MSKYTYLEQYINLDLPHPHNLSDRFVEDLKKMKSKKNKRLIKKIDKFIDYVDKNEKTNIELYQKAILEVTLFKYKKLLESEVEKNDKGRSNDGFTGATSR